MSNMEITISEKVKKACPDLQLACIFAEVLNSDSGKGLWQEIEAECIRISNLLTLEDVNKRPAISATRTAYKTFGKEPSRYRPSAEALCRRILRGLPLYKVNTLVDLINLVSIRSGHSIGGFDLDLIQGNLVLGVGESDEEFEAIGRGLLNIEGMPVYRDETGGIGTPTSDNERTKISESTKHLLMIINGYGGESGLKEAVDLTIELLGRYASLSNYEVQYK